jgi:hypothetical protein
LSAIELAAERPGLSVVDGYAFDPETIAEVGEVDAVLLINVLLQAVAPDWDRVLELYAPLTSCFVIVNPQWQGERTVRLIELGREAFLEAVPATEGHRTLFDRLDDWYPAQQRPYRDASTMWQWGVTDRDLVAKLAELGFALVHERNLAGFAGAEGFTNRAFVFSRPEFSGAPRRRLRPSPAVPSSAEMDTQTKETPDRADLGELERKLAAVERERDEWKARFNEVVNSSSWRLTQPLRALKRRNRR